MGLLDSAMGMLGKGGGGDMVSTLTGLLDQVGGVQGLLGKFGAAGLTEQADSWVSTGPNQDIDAGQVRQALGDDGVREVAQRAGVNEDEAASGLAQAIPALIDRLTPDGKVPDLDQVKGLLGGLLG